MSLTKRFMEENGYLEPGHPNFMGKASGAEMVTDCCGVPDRYYFTMDEWVCSRCDAEKPRRITREQYQQEQENQQ